MASIERTVGGVCVCVGGRGRVDGRTQWGLGGRGGRGESWRVMGNPVAGSWRKVLSGRNEVG